MRSATGIVVLVVLALSAGCTDRQPVDDPRTPSDGRTPAVQTATPTASPTSLVSSAGEGDSEPARDLVGLWGTSVEDVEFLYRFDPDGTYAYVAVLSQLRPGGTFQLSVEESGRVRIDGDRIVLTLESAVERRRDPDDPAGNYDEDLTVQPRTLRWNIEGSTLTLTASDGEELRLDRAEG